MTHRVTLRGWTALFVLGWLAGCHSSAPVAAPPPEEVFRNLVSLVDPDGVAWGFAEETVLVSREGERSLHYIKDRSYRVQGFITVEGDTFRVRDDGGLTWLGCHTLERGAERILNAPAPLSVKPYK